MLSIILVLSLALRNPQTQAVGLQVLQSGMASLLIYKGGCGCFASTEYAATPRSRGWVSRRVERSTLVSSSRRNP